MYCKHCGKTIDEGDRFCSYCGGALKPIAEEPAEIPALAAEQPTPIAQGTTPEEAAPATQEAEPAVEDAAPVEDAEAMPCELAVEDAALLPDSEDALGDCRERSAEELALEEARDKLSGEILRYGIMSLGFSCTLILSIVGMILGFVTQSKVAAYTELYGPVVWRAKVGKYIGNAGKIVGIVGTAYLCFYITIFTFIIGSGLLPFLATLF